MSYRAILLAGVGLSLASVASAQPEPVQVAEPPSVAPPLELPMPEGVPRPDCHAFSLSGFVEAAAPGENEGTQAAPTALPVPEGVIHIQSVARSLSGHVAFEGVYDRETGAPPLREWDATNLFVVSPDGLLTQLTTSDAGFDPAWSPAGDQLAFLDDDSVWLYDLATDDRRVLVRGGVSPEPQDEWDYVSYAVPVWSSDGALIAYFMSNGATADVRVVRVTSGEVLYLSAGETYAFAWADADRLWVYHDAGCTQLVEARTF